MSDRPTIQTGERPVWHQDQAAGLRRLFKPRRGMAMAFVSAMPGVGTTRCVARLGLALSAGERPVLLVDERGGERNLTAAFGTGFRFDLAKVLRGDASLAQALVPATGKVAVLSAVRAVEDLGANEAQGRRQLAATLGATWRGQSYVLSDARLEEAGHPLSVLSRAVSHVVLVVGSGTAAVTSSYLLVKRLAAAMPAARLLVLGSRMRGEDESRGIFENLAAVAREHLGVELTWLGWVPQDPGWRSGTISPLGAGPADLACERVALALRTMTEGKEGRDGTREGPSPAGTRIGTQGIALEAF